VVDLDRRPSALVVTTVVPYPPVGGGHKRTLRLLEAMVRAGAAPVVISRGSSAAGAEEELRARGIRLETVEPPKPSLAQRLQQHARRLPSPFVPAVDARVAELVASEQPAFVQLEHTQNAYYFRAVRGTPTVLSLHNIDSRLLATLVGTRRPGSFEWLRLQNRWRSMRTTERRGARAAQAVLCVSEDDQRHFLPLNPRTLLVPNGVDDALFDIEPTIPPGDNVLFFGQLDYAPNSVGIGRFLREGWPLVAGERPHAKLRIAGTGMSDELSRQVAASAGVEALGYVESLDGELAGSSAVVVPVWQGGGTRLKVLESMAAARPIAGTPLGVSGVGFEHGRHGLVADSPADLAAALVALLSDRDRAGGLAAQARSLAERYRWEAATEPAERLYHGWVEFAEKP
jgi:glycosyltransferase involved in cell wall biosynthesis